MDVKIGGDDKDWAKLLLTKDKYGNYIFKGSLLILDDYRGLLKSSNMDSDFYKVLSLRLFDLMYMMHNPKLILEGMRNWNTRFSIFVTESFASDFENKIPQFLPCQRAARIVNEYVKQFYGGTDSKEYRNLYPNFPHAIVTDESDKIHFMNMDEEKIKSLNLT